MYEFQVTQHIGLTAQKVIKFSSCTVTNYKHADGKASSIGLSVWLLSS